MAEDKKVANAGWVSLSKSGKSLTIRVLDQLFFVPLRDLDMVLKGRRHRTEVKQWIEQDQEKWIETNGSDVWE